MSIIEISLNIEAQGSGYFKVSALMSGQSYDLTFIWSTRSQCWYLNVDETVKGIKIVTGIDLLEPYHYMDTIPPGKLGAYRNSGRDSKPGFGNFGIDKEITLLYEEP
ncbi:hypothetical protein KKI24_14330 [bacterium]|nr:hypothetical protein [bacterium]